MSFSHYLFGDFSVEYRSSLAVSEAVGRLAAVADESIMRRPGTDAQLHGYVTRYEILLYQGNTFFINPFRPRFQGAFEEKDGGAVLRGKFVAMRFLKIWVSVCFLILFGTLFAAIFIPQHIHIDGSPSEFVLSLSITVAVLLALRLAMLPASPLIRSLESTILAAISGERPNNSIRSFPSIPSA